MGLLAVKRDKGSAHQSAKCVLFSGQLRGNKISRVSDNGGDAVKPKVLSKTVET